VDHGSANLQRMMSANQIVLSLKYSFPSSPGGREVINHKKCLKTHILLFLSLEKMFFY